METFELPEKPKKHHERVVGLIIAAIAVVLAIVSSVAHEIHNDEILAHIDSSDQYAFYQAKKERAANLQLAIDAMGLNPAGSHFIASYRSEAQRLTGEGKDIQAEGDRLKAEAESLARKAQVIDIGEIALQISVVLCSITILTEQNLFVRMGVTVAGLGVLIALAGFFFRT